MKLPFPLQRPTRANRAILPALLCAVLAALAMLQLALTRPVRLPPQGSAAGAMRAPAMRSDLTPVPEILATSIFASARLSGEAVGSTAPGAHVLAGALSVRGRSIAILQGPGGTMRRLPIGGTVDGMTLLAVGPDGASFRKDGQRVLVPFGQPAPAAIAPHEPQETGR